MKQVFISKTVMVSHQGALQGGVSLAHLRRLRPGPLRVPVPGATQEPLRNLGPRSMRNVTSNCIALRSRGCGFSRSAFQSCSWKVRGSKCVITVAVVLKMENALIRALDLTEAEKW